MSVRQRPGWWLGVFPTRYVAAITWLIVLHTAAVLCAALPVAVAAVVLVRQRAVQLGLVVAVLATAVAIIPSLSSTIWPIIWNSHPVFFVTDQIKLVVAVPFIAWVLRSASSNNRFERSRGSNFDQPRRGVDDLDKSASVIVGATPRRSTRHFREKSPDILQMSKLT
jgi:hypothetical protein